MRRVAVLAATLALVPASCGYTLVGQGRPTDPTIKTIGVPMFANHSGKDGLELKITAQVIWELHQRGGYKILPQGDGVDARVVGDLTAYVVAPIGFSQPTAGYTQAERYAISLNAKVRYEKAGQVEPLWQNDAFTFRDEFDIGDLNQYYFDREGIAIDRLAQDFSRSLVTSMFEAF
jgi:hypothetical protein